MPVSPIQGLQTAAPVAGDGAAIICATAPLNIPLTSTINYALRIKSSSPSSDPSNNQTNSSSTLSAIAIPKGPLILKLDTIDAHKQDLNAQSALTLATSLAGAILLCVRITDIARPNPESITTLFNAIERVLALRVARIAPTIPNRRLLIVSILDYDEEQVSKDELTTAVKDHVEKAYSNIDLPQSFAATQFDDVFDLNVLPIPSEKHLPNEYESAITQLGDLLKDTNRKYSDASLTADELPELVEKISNAMEDDSFADLPGDVELKATFACNSVVRTVLAKYRVTIVQWNNNIDAGILVRNYGSQTDLLIQNTLDSYVKDASMYSSARAFERKKEELKDKCLSEAYALFAKQILKIRETAYQKFRTMLTRIRINDQVEKNVRGAVKDAEDFFVKHAESLRSQLGNWRFDNERHELVNHMRDDATERLQLARLQGNYVPPMRAPIAFAFHTLLSAPFGQDSRYVHPHAEEMKQKFDPDKFKQPGMMRSRPRQRNFVIKLGSREAIDPNYTDMFDSLFEEESKKEKS